MKKIDLVNKIASFMEAKAELIEAFTGAPKELYWTDKDKEGLMTFTLKQLREGLKNIKEEARRQYARTGKVLLATTCIYCKIPVKEKGLIRCSSCPYGKVHTPCNYKHSDFSKISSYISSLHFKVSKDLYRAHKELFEKSFRIKLKGGLK